MNEISLTFAGVINQDERRWALTQFDKALFVGRTLVVTFA